MTKEELEKEAEEYADTVKCEWENDTYWVDCRDKVTDGYIAGAEPREKRIARLEEENEKLKGDLELWESGACRATNLDKCGVVKELEAQIEKMKCDLLELRNNSYDAGMYLKIDELIQKWEIKEK